MSGKAVIILLVGVIVIAASTFGYIFDTTSRTSGNVNKFYYSQSASNAAESGMNIALRDLKNQSNWNILVGQQRNVTLFGCNVIYSYSKENFHGVNSYKIVSICYAPTDTMVNVVYVKEPVPPSLQASVKAAIGAASNIKVPGQMEVDGMDHDINTGNAITASGTYAIWTSSLVNKQGQPQLGGTYYTGGVGTDIIPPKKADWGLYGKIIVENSLDPFPNSPDSVFGGSPAGFPPGTLLQMAKDKTVTGSQWVTDPSALTFPLKGITYVELPDGQTWGDANIEGSGVLIVHNSSGNAGIKVDNAGKNDGKVFKGIVIVDELKNFHGEIWGAVIILGNQDNNKPDGNGKGKVKYCKDALKLAQQTVTLVSGPIKDNVLGWWEGKYQYAKNLFNL